MGLEGKLNFVDLGLMRYGDALAVQEKLVEARARDEIDDTLLFVEHPTVITLGYKGSGDEIRKNEKELVDKGIEIYKIERGGYSFLHNPGQVVGYPIRLIDRRVGRKYMDMLQQAILDVARGYDVDAVLHPLLGINWEGNPPLGTRRKRYHGVWYRVGTDLYHKIGAIGVQIRGIEGRHVTMHGFAFNVNNDTSLFNQINMCGFETETCISLRDILGGKLPIEEVKARLLERFAKNFGYSSIQRRSTVDEVLSGGIPA